MDGDFSARLWEYIISQGMSVLKIDRDADLGTYVEPNIWVQHL